MTNLRREQLIAVAALGLLVLACSAAVALTLSIRADAAQELADRQDALARLEARAGPRADQGAPSKPAAAPVEAFLDAPTLGLAGADLQAYVARLADRHAALVSFGQQASAGEDALNIVRIEASLDIKLPALQVLLYQLESGTPYVFVESMTVHSTNTAPSGDAENQTLRVTLGLSAFWRRRPA
jgi:general secretion pathway protein M